MKKIFLLGLIILFLAGCAITQESMRPEERQAIQTRVFEVDYNTAFEATKEVFLDRGFVIREIDKENGLIDTDYKQGGNMFAKLFFGHIRTKLNAILNKIDENHTKIRLMMLVEEQDNFGGMERMDVITKDYYDKYWLLYLIKYGIIYSGGE